MAFSDVKSVLGTFCLCFTGRACEEEREEVGVVPATADKLEVLAVEDAFALGWRCSGMGGRSG